MMNHSPSPTLQDVQTYCAILQIRPDLQPEVEKAQELTNASAKIRLNLDESHKSPNLSKKQQLGITTLKSLRWTLEQFIVCRKTLYGKGYPTEKLKEQSGQVAVILTVTNLINIITSGPLFFLLLKSTPFYPIPPFFLTLLILVIMNASGSKAAANSPYKPSQVALSLFFLLNMIQSLVGGVGIELMLNRTGLSDLRSEQLITETVIKPLEQRKEDIKNSEEAKTLEEVSQKCQEGKKALDKRSSQYHSEHIRLLGSYQDTILPLEQRSYYQSPLGLWPDCPETEERQRLLDEKILQVEEELDKTKEKLANQSSFLYLKENRPIIYERNFDSDGYIKDPVPEALVAKDLFFQNLITLKWGLSFYGFVLSMVTSIWACYLIVAHSQRDDVQMSWSEEVIQARDRFFTDKIKILVEAESLTSQVNTNGNGHNHHKVASVNELELEVINPDITEN